MRCQMFKLTLQMAEEQETLFMIHAIYQEQKKVSKYFIDYKKAFDCVDHINLRWQLLTAFMRHLYTNHNATVETKHRQKGLTPSQQRTEI